MKKGSSSLLKKPSQRPAVDDSMIYHESSGARMRGAFADQGGLFSYISPEARVPSNHPLRKIRALVRDVLSELNRSLGRLYASEGRPSIPPEQFSGSARIGLVKPNASVQWACRYRVKLSSGISQDLVTYLASSYRL